jgi:uncharacterized protein (DUF302 family)
VVSGPGKIDHVVARRTRGSQAVGIALQYFAIAPMRGLGLKDGVIAAAKADFVSLSAFEVGLFGWMAVMAFVLFPAPHHLVPSSAASWLLMQVGLIIGFFTSWPANVWRVRCGIKVPMWTDRRTAMTEAGAASEAGIVTKFSPRSVPDTVARLSALVAAKGMKLFAVIDQAAEAREAGLDLRDTTLVIFGSPAAGTPVMAASPLAAVDLPLKVLVWDDSGRVKVSYNAPAWLAARHGLGEGLAGNLVGIDALTDALVAA